MARRRKKTTNPVLFYWGAAIILLLLIYQTVPGLIYAAVVIAAVALIAPRIYRWRKRVIWRRKVLISGINNIDVMKGTDFELYLKALFEQQGYKVEMTPASNDFGADLILTGSGGKRIAVQAKRYEKTVGVDAVQQAAGARSHYGATDVLVVTNQNFSQQAIQLAQSNRVTLINREALIELIAKAKGTLKGTA